MSTSIGGTGLFLSLILLGVLCYKGLHVYASCAAATAVVILSNGLAVPDGMALFTQGLASFVERYILYFFVGAVFGAVMDATGCAEKLGSWLLEKIGSGGATFAIMLASTILTAGGITGYVLVLVVFPIAIVIFRGAKLPPVILPAVIGAGTTVGVGFLPYSSSVNNMIPTEYLGTSIASGAFYGCAGAVLMYVFCLLYFRYAARKIVGNGRTLSDEELENMYAVYDLDPHTAEEKRLPSLACAGIPMVVSIGLTILLINITSWTSLNVVLLSVTLAIFICMALNHSFLENPSGIVSKGIGNAINICMITAAVMGFAEVVTKTPAYESIVAFITTIDISPYFTAVISASLLAAVTANSVGGIRMSMQSFAEYYLASGADAGAIHKITVISGLGLNTMPHSGSVLSALRTCKVSFKGGFTAYFITSGLIPMMTAVILAVIAVVIAPA